MEILLVGIAAMFLSVLLISGWAMLLLTPLVVLLGAIVDCVVEGGSSICRFLAWSSKRHRERHPLHQGPRTPNRVSVG